MQLVGGIEGGATNTTIALFDHSGKMYGPYSVEKSTNHWTIGRDACYQNITDLVHHAKTQCGCPLDTPLHSLCLSLSGMEDVREREKLIAALRVLDPHLSNNYSVCNDSVGSLATSSPSGGIVLIAGTGSMCRLVTTSPSGEAHYRCGGWGHAIGDEGSAFYIAHKAVRTVYHAQDGIYPRTDAPLAQVQESIARIKEKMDAYYGLHDRSDILPHLYSNFAKANFAGFAASVAELAQQGDLISTQIFQRAGRWLGRHIRAVLGNLTPEERARLNPVDVICVGSVWKSWAAIRAGFVEALAADPADSALTVPAPPITVPFRLLELTISSAVGAALLAASQINFAISGIDRSKYVRVLFESQ